MSEKWIKIIQQYYAGILSKCFQEFSPSSWHHHQRGIFIGCTVSIVLFLAAINRSEMKAFMDELFVISSSIKGTQLLLHRCTQVLTWAGMSFRAEKSRCIVIDGGVVKNVTPFTVNLLNSEKSQVIPSIHTQPVRFIGRRIFLIVRTLKLLIFTFKNGLNDINSSKNNGIHKVFVITSSSSILM